MPFALEPGRRRRCLPRLRAEPKEPNDPKDTRDVCEKAEPDEPLLERDVPILPADEPWPIERVDPSSTWPEPAGWPRALIAMLDAETAFSIMSIGTGSCSGGECSHRSIGFISLKTDVSF